MDGAVSEWRRTVAGAASAGRVCRGVVEAEGEAIGRREFVAFGGPESCTKARGDLGGGSLRR